jgi:hypothetical protein
MQNEMSLLGSTHFHAWPSCFLIKIKSVYADFWDAISNIKDGEIACSDQLSLFFFFS